MKRMPLLAWIAILALAAALVATLAADAWLWSAAGNRALQALGAGLTLPMRLITFLGDELFYLAFIPLVYWCLHKALGADLGVLLVLSSLVNGLAKSFVKHNRPYWADAGLGLDAATSFSTPSGHAQTSAALFGKVITFASRSGLRWLWAGFCGLLIVLVAASRVYLGVHYVGDVLWGIAIGLALVSLYDWLKPRLLPTLRRLPLGLHALCAVAAAAVIVGVQSALLVTPFGTAQGFPKLFLDAWGAALEDAATVGGMVTGLWIGLVVESRHVHFSVAGPWWQRVLRYLVGMAGLVGIWMGLKLIFPSEPLMLGLALRVVRYTLAMLWAIAGWPWLFVRIGLGRREAGSGAGGRAAGGAPLPGFQA